MKTDTKPAGSQRREVAVPPAGALGLLALGYRGLEAWRAARGTDWVDERRREWESATAAAASKTDETE